MNIKFVSPPTNSSDAPAAGPSSVPLQVGGHPGTLELTADGSFVIKKILPTEREFYEALNSNPALAQLREWVPQLYGTLRLEGMAGSNGTFVPAPSVGPTGSESLVLENLCQYFVKANVLDVKLGKVLYDESATPEKRTRMEQRARETTSGETGIRLTGFHVYDRTTGEYSVYPKKYGRALTVDQLPSGISTFFPCSTSPTSSGLPPDLLVEVLRGIEEDIEELIEVLQKTEIRMIGGSVLIVYEGQEQALREALKRMEEAQSAADGPQDGEGDDEDEDMDEESEPEGTGRAPWLVRLIDFAHTRPAPGQGPDEGVIFGLRTLLQLLKGRRAEVEQIAGGSVAGQGS